MVCTATYIQAQGNLTPPGAPAPTMKTLQQIEPRTPLESGSPGVSIDPSGTIVISQSGSYYLTENLTVSSGNGITINASGITVDLRGFTIRSTLADSASSGIRINAARVSIYNGNIESGTTYDGGAGGDQFTGPGFDYGIYASSSSAYTGIRIRDITVSGCDLHGIYIASGDSLVESCTVRIVGGTGIKAGIVNNCTANYCGSIAIDGTSSVSDCRGGSQGDDGIRAWTVANSYGTTWSSATTAEGIYASKTVQNSYGMSAGGDGIHSEGTVADSYGITYATTTGAEGIYAAKTVQNSYGESSGGDGIHSGGAVADSYGITTSTLIDADGVYAANTVQNSYGESSGGDGIHSQGTVASSYGITTSTLGDADGIYAARTVQNSYGTSVGGIGILTATSANDYAGTVTDSYGMSSNGIGIRAGIVANSYGYTTGTSISDDGISASRTVQNSYGYSAGGTGIDSDGTVVGSYGKTGSQSVDGIRADTVADSYGYSAGAMGIWAQQTVQNSYGRSGGDGNGIQVLETIHNHRGAVTGSNGVSAGGIGIFAGRVSNSSGKTTGTSIDSFGINAAHTVQNSYGYSAGGDGIQSQGTVANSYGLTTGTDTSSDGIHSYWTVQNSFGVSSGGNGIYTSVASYSRGESAGTDASADGIQATLAVGCTAVGGENIGNKYLMP